MGSALGALKVAARHAGMTPEEYAAKRAAGLKRCTGCKEWHPVSEFHQDRSRSDGLKASCRTSSYRYTPVGLDDRKPMGPKGGRMDESARAKMRAAWARRREEGLRPPRLGIKHSMETRALISQKVRENAVRGPESHFYKDGKGAERHNARLGSEAKRWRFDVMLRDRFTCQDCGDSRGGNLNAHHIKPWAQYPDLRLDLDNGKTLCTDCHKAVHQGGGAK